MLKITLMGAGSTVFAKNILGDCMLTEGLRDSELSLYDIDGGRLEDSVRMLSAINNNGNNGRANITAHLGESQRKEALRQADFVINTIQVGGYDPATIADFAIPKKFGLQQTIGDTLGIGGIFRALRTIPVMEAFAADMQAVCPDAWLLNYTNPMAMLTGFMQRYTPVRTVGLCHSVQTCTPGLLKKLDMKEEGYTDRIAGINHMGWLLEVRDAKGKDLYPEIRERVWAMDAEQTGDDRVRFEYIKRFGYYCTESSEHNAEYNPFFIKRLYPSLIQQFNIPLDEYPRRCIRQIQEWEERRDQLVKNEQLSHDKTHEYASSIIRAMTGGDPCQIGGNVMNDGWIENLPADACVEVPCGVDRSGLHPERIGRLPTVLAAMNQTNINVQLLTIEAAVTKRKEHIYQAAMLDPHTGSELSIDDIVLLCDELIEAHQAFLPDYR